MNADRCRWVWEHDRKWGNLANVTVVDDFIKKGATFLAAAALIRHHAPNATVRVFALIRTLDLQPEIAQIVGPCVASDVDERERSESHSLTSVPPREVR